ncbi:UrcA family protein [Sphingomonas oryzagri]|uniref:UrcA family protein n=1 Tax=Sphingomonas oryzagri TaxID=3042314 RepID=A0ABT6MXP9_9SPHN|nr:UrcA family protein [Sphingomonas oryzagri]MDH7637556.1 UrcA family protein [Sphingomonas oryzagri]
MRKFVTTLMFAGASLLGTAGIVAYADPAMAETPTATVHYQSAELASTDGRAAIAKRIRFAAARVCETTEAGQQFAEGACRTQAYAGAAAELSAR